MVDVFEAEKRSEIMSRVRSSGNLATEIRLIRIFRTYGINGWRRNISVFGKPDFVFPKSRLAVFVDGCFGMRARYMEAFLSLIVDSGRKSCGGISSVTD